MNVKLVMAKGQARGHVIQLKEPRTVLGRLKECQVRIPSADVSRRHCVLSFEDGILYVEDLGSTNGTLINGAKIKSKERLDPGDMLEVGPVSFAVQYDAPQAVGDDGVIALVDDVDPNNSMHSRKTTTIDLRAKDAGAKTQPPPPIDDVEVVEEAEEAIDVEFNMDDEPLQFPPDGDFRDILSELDK